jgi:hypothetical protein
VGASARAFGNTGAANELMAGLICQAICDPRRRSGRSHRQSRRSGCDHDGRHTRRGASSCRHRSRRTRRRAVARNCSCRMEHVASVPARMSGQEGWTAGWDLWPGELLVFIPQAEIQRRTRRQSELVLNKETVIVRREREGRPPEPLAVVAAVTLPGDPCGARARSARRPERTVGREIGVGAATKGIRSADLEGAESGSARGTRER